MSFELAEKVADAVLYEGYVLYPYRASAAKNRLRWQFGVRGSPRLRRTGGSEPWAMQTECLIEPAAEAGVELDLRVRFLQVQARVIEAEVEGAFHPVETLEVDERTLVTWEEGVERRFDATAIALSDLLAGERRVTIELPAGREIEAVSSEDGRVAARIVRERWPVSGVVHLSAEPVDEGLVRLRVRIENLGSGGAEPTARGRSGVRWWGPTLCSRCAAAPSCRCSIRLPMPRRPRRRAPTSTPGRC